MQVNPGKARNSVASLFSSDEAIKKIFNDNINQNFYQDLIYIWNLYEDYIKNMSKKTDSKTIQNSKLIKFYTISATYIYYLFATNLKLFNSIKNELNSNFKEEGDIIEFIMNSIQNIDINNLNSMLKTYEKSDIFSFFNQVHQVINTQLDIMKEVCRETNKSFDVPNITKTQKTFGEKFILPIVKAFQSEKYTIESKSFSIFQNKK